MANIKYFADLADGTTVQLDRVAHDGSPYVSAKHFYGFVNGQKITATRAIERKSNPSMHKCDDRCTNAKGFKCECSCGGKNHGAGSFICEAA